MCYTTKDITRMLIPQIRDLALRGQTDVVWFDGRSDKYMYDVGEDIYWQIARQFLILYIESFCEGGFSYRLYRCSGEARYDRRTVMNPAPENEEFRCLFRYSDSGAGKITPYLFDGGQWYEEFEATISEYINEY